MSLHGIQLLGSEHVVRQHVRARRGLQLLVSDIGLQRSSRARHGLSAGVPRWEVNTCSGHHVRAQCTFMCVSGPRLKQRFQARPRIQLLTVNASLGSGGELFRGANRE